MIDSSLEVHYFFVGRFRHKQLLLIPSILEILLLHVQWRLDDLVPTKISLFFDLKPRLLIEGITYCSSQL